MTATQMSLFERRLQQAAADVDTLVAELYAVKTWRKRSQLCLSLGWSERRLRLAGERAGGQVIFGQKGYRHIRWASIEEIKACCATLFSQARRNSERAIETQRAFHQWGGPKEVFA